MKALELHLQNGQILTVDATSATTRTNAGELVALEWTTPEKHRRRLLHIDVAQVAAVVVVD